MFLPFVAPTSTLSSSSSMSASRIAALTPGSFSRILPSKVKAAFSLEVASYPADEAATLEKLQLRAEVAGDYFWGVSDGEVLIAFVCGTLTCGSTLTEESMSVHEPEGTTLCIHSVVVAEERRRLGLGTAMLKAYVKQVADHTPVRTILLMCKEPLIPFYADAGFTLVGQSDVVHGLDPWFEMRCQTSAWSRSKDVG